MKRIYVILSAAPVGQAAVGRFVDRCRTVGAAKDLARFFVGPSALLRMTMLMYFIMFSGCATGRDLTSPNYLPEWENQLVNFPAPSETSGGRWIAQGTQKAAHGVGNALLFPFAIVGNVAVNSYYVPTWPFRSLFRGDKRLIVWHPLFGVGSTVGSDFYSKEWNYDLV